MESLRQGFRVEGFGYPLLQFARGIREVLERLSARVISKEETLELLRCSFPENPQTLEALTEQLGIPILTIDNLNSMAARAALRGLNADLGVALGTEVLLPPTFSVPRLGCITLHNGRVPEYRGEAPEFWQLYDNQDYATVTVHLIDGGLNTGDVLGEASVPIHSKDSPVTLGRKLDQCGTALLARCVQDLALGRALRRSQESQELNSRPTPTRIQIRELGARRGARFRGQDPRIHILKTIFYLVIWHCGIFRFVRFIRSFLGINRACILAYHRVNDVAEDALTTGVERFAEHMVTLRKYYTVIPTSQLIDTLRAGSRLPDRAVVIHFDDCYQDVYANASRMLAQVRFPACCFLASGHIGTDRVFAHDKENYPVPMTNLRPEEVVDLAALGLEIGSHTVNHVDLGRCGLGLAVAEVTRSKRDLEALVARPVRFIAYPFGQRTNIRSEVVECIRAAGYEAIFSTYGGYVYGGSSLFDMRRCGMSGEFRPLDLMMAVEGLSLSAFRRILQSYLGAPKRRGPEASEQPRQLGSTVRPGHSQTRNY